MAENQQVATDKGIGLAVLFTLLAVGGAFAVFLSPETAVAGWGFAAAMVSGCLAVAAIHLYE